MSATPDLTERYRDAPDFRSYLDQVEKHRDLWRGIWERVRIPGELAERARKIDTPVHLLALSEDWCGDAVNTLPVVARLAETLPGWDLRVLARDENPDLMDTHLTNGRSRSIPVVMVLDGHFDEVGWWGPRPSELQEWVMGKGQALPSKERYRKTRRWYARDRGLSTLRELLDMVEGGWGTAPSRSADSASIPSGE